MTNKSDHAQSLHHAELRVVAFSNKEHLALAATEIGFRCYNAIIALCLDYEKSKLIVGSHLLTT